MHTPSSPKTPPFYVDDHEFSITFENGYTVSVRVGPHNYCDSRPSLCGRTADNAEVALIDQNGDFVPFNNGALVEGYQSPGEVLALITKASTL